MAYIIIDLEFNGVKGITKYYKDFFDEHSELKDVGIENEIIEIGAIKVDKYMKPVCSMREYIKPTIFPIINPIVNEITKIDMEILKDRGISFEEAMSKLRDMFEDGDVLCSWAKDDIVELIINSNYHNYKQLEWINGYLDLQEYAMKILVHKKALGLKSALDELKIKIDESKLHDALNDAEYTVEVFKRIYNSRVIKNYIINDIYNMPALNVENLKERNIDEEDLKLLCPKCNKKVNLETPLKLLNWRFAAVGACPKCKNNILCEVSIKKTLKDEEIYIENNSILKSEAYLKYCYKLNNLDENKENVTNI